MGVLSKEEDSVAIERLVEQLARRFDTLQIFASRHSPDEGGTVYVSRGFGNLYARYGQAKMWANQEESNFMMGDEGDD